MHIKEFDGLKAISWIKSAWWEVSDQIVINCFRKCGFQKERLYVQALDQEEAEFGSLVKELSSEVSPSGYVDFGVEAATSQIPVDVER